MLQGSYFPAFSFAEITCRRCHVPEITSNGTIFCVNLFLYIPLAKLFAQFSGVVGNLEFLRVDA
jgi:hypothetical protein